MGFHKSFFLCVGCVPRTTAGAWNAPYNYFFNNLLSKYHLDLPPVSCDGQHPHSKGLMGINCQNRTLLRLPNGTY